MEDWVFGVIIAVILAVSMIGAGVVLWVLMKNQPQKAQGNHPKKDKQIVKSDRRTFFQHKLGQRWLFFAVCWPAVCVAFGGVILYQSLQGIADRNVGELLGIGVGLAFFVIGMAMLYKSNQRRVLATSVVMAKVVGIKSYYPFQSSHIKRLPVYEFYAEGANYKVTSRHTVGRDPVEKGQGVELYYVPGRPELIYEPRKEKQVGRVALVLCGIGMFFSFVTLVAPWIDPYIS